MGCSSRVSLRGRGRGRGGGSTRSMPTEDLERHPSACVRRARKGTSLRSCIHPTGPSGRGDRAPVGVVPVAGNIAFPEKERAWVQGLCCNHARAWIRNLFFDGKKLKVMVQHNVNKCSHNKMLAIAQSVFDAESIGWYSLPHCLHI